MRWEMLPSFAPFWEAALRAPGRVIKESPAKLVTTCELSGRNYYLKRYRHGSHTLVPLKFFWKRSQARQEWELAREMEARGVPVVRHLALGEYWSWTGLRESILITEGFPGEPVRAQTAREAEAICAFLARMHEAGVIQHDLHGANLLWEPRSGEIRLVDLYGSEIKQHISQAERDRNLAVLRMTLPIPVSAEVAALSQRLRRTALAYRSKRAWKHNREFAPKRVGGLRWQVRLPFCNGKAEKIMAAPHQFLDEEARILKAGRSATVGAADGFVLKRYNYRRPVNLLKDLFRRSRAFRAFRKAYHLELAGIATARPVAAANRIRLGVATSSYFLMEEIPESTGLRDFAGNLEQAIAAVAELLARLHEEGFTHRDLKLSNLVFDGGGRPYLIDLEGLHFAGEVSTQRARADLARLWRGAQDTLPLTRQQVTVFLRRYCRLRAIKPDMLA
jgi:tRNA A-37 threonylcarbamoyl transferase component Bud32